MSREILQLIEVVVQDGAPELGESRALRAEMWLTGQCRKQPWRVGAVEAADALAGFASS